MRIFPWTHYFGLVFLFVFAVFSSYSAAAQIVLTKVSDLDFGTVEFETGYNGRVYLGTDGSLSTDGSGLVVSGTGRAGNVGISATPNDVIEIKCRKNNTLTTSGGNEIKVTQSEAAIDTGVPFGSGVRCDNLGGAKQPVAVIDLAANPNPNVLIGGRIRLRQSDNLTSGTYSTSNSGGRVQRVRVIFQ